MSVAARCDQLDDERSLRLALLDELRLLVPFDAHAWLLTDPATEVGVAPIADVPCLPELPRLIRSKYATTLNRWTSAPAGVAALQASSGGHPESSLVWREVQAEHDVRDVASLTFRDRHGCWGFLDLWRCDGTYSEAHLSVLDRHVGAITTALRRCVRRSFTAPPPRPDPRPGPAVLVLSDQLRVRAQTSETEQLLRGLVPPDGDRPAIPAGAYNVAAQLLAVEAGVDDHPPAARVHLRSVGWLALRAARMGDDIAVTIEPAGTGERLDLLARSAALTPREAQVLELVATGADTRAVARTLSVSEHTVQDHLKAVFAKTEASSRRDLLARVSG